jgi:hypothetical protein
MLLRKWGGSPCGCALTQKWRSSMQSLLYVRYQTLQVTMLMSCRNNCCNTMSCSLQ